MPMPECLAVPLLILRQKRPKIQWVKRGMKKTGNASPEASYMISTPNPPNPIAVTQTTRIHHPFPAFAVKEAALSLPLSSSSPFPLSPLAAASLASISMARPAVTVRVA